MKNLVCVADDASCGLGGQALAPAILLDHEREFNLISALDVPWQQTAPTQKLAGMAVNRGPQAQLGMNRVATHKPLEFLFRFLMGSSSVRKVPPDLRVSIERVQRLHILRLKVAQQKAFGTEDDHGTPLLSLQGLPGTRPRRTTVTCGASSFFAAQVLHGWIDPHSTTPHRISCVRLANRRRPLKVFTGKHQIPAASPAASVRNPAALRNVSNPVPESGPRKRKTDPLRPVTPRGSGRSIASHNQNRRIGLGSDKSNQGKLR